MRHCCHLSELHRGLQCVLLKEPTPHAVRGAGVQMGAAPSALLPPSAVITF